ncbi:MAG: FliA/WhiG family RNA polymerase sigma factor [Deltaproteobacteria bacterium]|nr:MAG: FliA/WhiG family RNA polymerase sigma factor [Deltaproteobacteria bacterium]
MHRAVAEYATGRDRESELIRHYGHLIDRNARRIAARVGDMSLVDDLWSVGALGLVDAASRFDAAQEVRFETFVEHRIRGAMLDELRRMDHLPRRLRQRTDRLARARQKLEHRLGREPDAFELAESLGWEVEEIESLDSVARPPLRLEEIDEPAVPSAGDGPLDALERARQRERLAEAVAALPERLQIVLSLRLVEGLSLKEIAKILGVSAPRVCQLHNDAVRKVKAYLGL